MKSPTDQMAPVQVVGEVISLGEGFWTQDRRKSGLHVDVLRGQNIPGNSKAIDSTRVPDGVVKRSAQAYRAGGVRDQSRMVAIRHEARGAAREPGGGTPGRVVG